MSLTFEAIYENGVLKPAEPLPFKEHEKVQVTVHAANTPATKPGRRTGYGMIRWTRSIEELDFLIHDVENDPLEGP